MKKKRLIGNGIAQALFALLLTFFVSQGAFAADACDCPACPAHSCSHVDCIVGHDGAACQGARGDACTSMSGGSLLPAPRVFGLSFGIGIAVIASSTAVGIAGDSANARGPAVPRSAAPPAHIVFCRLLR